MCVNKVSMLSFELHPLRLTVDKRNGGYALIRQIYNFRWYFNTQRAECGAVRKQENDRDASASATL